MDSSMNLLRIALEDACQEDGCPICHVLWRREQDWLEMFLRERGADPGMGKLMRDSLGLCQHHAWTIGQQTDLEGPLALVFVYDNLLDYLLSRQSDPGSHLYQSLSKATPGEHCPACVARRHNEDACIREFARAMTDGEMARLYSGSAGLCTIHLHRVLLEAEPTVKLHLLNAHMARLASVLTGLQRMECTLDIEDTEIVCRAMMLVVGRNEAEEVQPHRHSSEVAGRCVLCTAEQQAVREHLSELCQDKLTGAMRLAWLCTKHAWGYRRMAGQRGATKAFLCWLTDAVTSVVRATEADINDVHAAMAAKPAPFGWLSHWQRIPMPGTRQCSACAAASGAGYAWTARMAEGTVCSVICLRHASVVIRALPECRQKLLGGLVAQLAQAQSDLRAYIRTRNWEYRLERTEASQTSWHRAIELFVGHTG